MGQSSSHETVHRPPLRATAASILPGLSDVFFFTVLAFLLWLRPGLLFADASTGWHLTTGRYVLEHRAVPRVDLLSYTFPDRPWVAYEWLADAWMDLLVRLGGLPLLAVAFAGSLGLLTSLLYARCRAEGCNFIFVAVLSIVGIFVSSIHWLARPHVVTFFGVYLFSTILEDFYRGAVRGRRWLAMLPTFMVVWVNSHPAFLFGLALIAIYATCLVARRLFAGDTEVSHQCRVLAPWAALTFLATLCNPYFAGLYGYIARHLGNARGLARIEEWASPTFHGDLQPACLEILFSLFVIGLVVTRRRLSAPSLLTCVAFGHLSLVSQRNMPMFVIVALPAIARLWSATKRRPMAAGQRPSRLRSLAESLSRRLQEADANFRRNEAASRALFWPVASLALLTAIAARGGSLGGTRVLESDPWSEKPTTTLAAITRLDLEPSRGFSIDNWGGYLNYRLGIRVFVDDRADFFPEEFYADYRDIIGVAPGWDALLERYGVEWTLLPNRARLARALKATGAWDLVALDDSASLFVRTRARQAEPPKERQRDP